MYAFTCSPCVCILRPILSCILNFTCYQGGSDIGVIYTHQKRFRVFKGNYARPFPMVNKADRVCEDPLSYLSITMAAGVPVRVNFGVNHTFCHIGVVPTCSG